MNIRASSPMLPQDLSTQQTPKPWDQAALSFPHCFPGLFASLSAGKSWEQLPQSPQQWDSIRAHTKTLAHGLHAKLSRLKISTRLPALVGFLLMKNNKFAGKYLRECSTPRWKHWTFKCHTCQMLKREDNKEYKARLLKEPPLELLQLLGRNKTLDWRKRQKCEDVQRAMWETSNRKLRLL